MIKKFIMPEEETPKEETPEELEEKEEEVQPLTRVLGFGKIYKDMKTTIATNLILDLCGSSFPYLHISQFV